MRLAGLAAVAIVGYVVLRVVFGIAGGLIGLLLGLAWFVLKAMLVLGVAYFVLTLVAPDTARRVREALSGPPVA